MGKLFVNWISIIDIRRVAKRISDNFFFDTFEQRDSLEKLLLSSIIANNNRKGCINPDGEYFKKRGKINNSKKLE